MDPVHLNNDDNASEESSCEKVILPSSPELSGISGDPRVLPRVGDEYQAEIPPMISETKIFRLSIESCDLEGIFHGYHIFMGLLMPITWVPNKKTAEEDEGCGNKNSDNSPNANGLTNFGTNRKSDALKDSLQNAEAQGLVMDNEREPKSVGTKVVMKDAGKYLVPDSLYQMWSDAEVDSFILGLYLFGKIFIKIKRFMGEKEMGDILFFYYGEFYRSEGYRRWSDCQRTRRKKCIYGRKLFTGWRNEELLSRLHPHVPEHSQNSLLEVSTAFSEGKVSLQDYVCKLKTMVGIQAVVDAVGIGKGKTDLTSISTEPGKNNPLFAVCPSRKACSALTCNDIINLLTGSFCLSKGRCSDIFREAVWPRLLARGWHSEQPRNQSYLVFLFPSVKKFSKRKLVKGKHYFDSISDVLSKVASELKLIEVEDKEAIVGSNEDDNCAAEVPSGRDDPSIRQMHCYLKPRAPGLKLVSFTVVDSSLVDGGKIYKIREMRYVLRDVTVKSLSTSCSGGIAMKCLDNPESNDDQIAVDTSLDSGWNANKVDHCETAPVNCSPNRTQFTIIDTSSRNAGNLLKVRELRFAPRIKVTSETKSSSRKTKRPSKDSSDVQVSDAKGKNYKFNRSMNTSESDEEPLSRKIRDRLVETSLQDKHNVSGKNQSARIIKYQFSRRSKSGHSNNLVPVVRRRRLTACSNSDLNCVIKSFYVGQSKQKESCCGIDHPDRGSNTQKSSFTASSVEDLEESSRSVLETPCLGVRTSCRGNVRHQTPSCIEMNQLQVPPDVEMNEPAEEVRTKNKCGFFNPDKPNPEALNGSTDVCPVEESNANSRRLSKRSRPLTTRALEALEYGFISMKKQRSMSVQSKRQRTSKRVRITEFSDLEEGDADGALGKKDLAEETPDRNSDEHNLVIIENISEKN